jgi:hypothetical protein
MSSEWEEKGWIDVRLDRGNQQSTKDLIENPKSREVHFAISKYKVSGKH